VVPQIPYLHGGSSWTLRSKHGGTGARKTTQGGLSEIHSYTDFVAAGQDAFALVGFAPYGGNAKLNAVNLQISAFPVPHSMIFIADAAAVKVRPL
jgi:hypothetical protein